MSMGSALLAVHNALSKALLLDMPDITYASRDWVTWNQLSEQEQTHAVRNKTVPQKTNTRRPHEDDVEVFMFPQTWGSTALGYGGVGGAAMTSAYTVVVSDHDCHCVYFGGAELAYKVKYSELSVSGRENLRSDLQTQNMADVRHAPSRYTRAQVQS